MTLRKGISTAGVVLIGLSAIALLFLGMRRESVRLIQRSREAVLRTELRTIRDAVDNYTLDKHRRSTKRTSAPSTAAPETSVTRIAMMAPLSFSWVRRVRPVPNRTKSPQVALVARANLRPIALAPATNDSILDQLTVPDLSVLPVGVAASHKVFGSAPTPFPNPKPRNSVLNILNPNLLRSVQD